MTALAGVGQCEAVSAGDREQVDAEQAAVPAPAVASESGPSVAPSLGWPSSPASVLALQRSAGNGAVARMLDSREEAVRGRVSQETGFDLSAASVHPRSPLADADGRARGHRRS